MEVTVYFCDDELHYTSKETWTSTPLTISENYLLDGGSIDWSNPDHGIYFKRMFASTIDGDVYYFLGEDDEIYKLKTDLKSGTKSKADLSEEDKKLLKQAASVCIFSPEELNHALTVSVDGQLVLVRILDDVIPMFKCGLSFPGGGIVPDFEEEEDSATDTPDDTPEVDEDEVPDFDKEEASHDDSEADEGENME